MTSFDYHRAEFILSAAKLAQLPPDEGIEIAFAGRSNAGKSSALNTLTRNKNLARTSKTPGRTQLLNLFRLDEERRLMDLPGYGFAKVSKEVKEKWQRLLSHYLQTRESLYGLVLLMDCRHPLKDFDIELLDFAQYCNLAVHILLTKSDKLSRGAGNAVLQKVKQQLSHYENPVSVQLFSSLNKDGLQELRAKLDEWFSLVR